MSTDSTAVKIILQNAAIDTNDSVKVANVNVTSVTESLAISGLATLSDGNHNFFKIQVGASSEIDYIYKESDGTK